MKTRFVTALCFLLFLASIPIPAPAETGSDTLYVKKVENLTEDFILGMDASSVISQEQSGVIYLNEKGEKEDVFAVLSENGINTIRVRVWNDPYDSRGNGFGGGNCDIEKCVQIGQRAKKYGMTLMVDFHYSDFWADPGKQMTPRAWKNLSIEEKTQALYEYTRDCLLLLRDANVDVSIVQLGNETNGKMCGEKTWFNIQYLMQAGSRAVREVYPSALVAVHFANPEKADSYMNYAKKLDYYKVDYDVFASSYYPYWHGTLENLSNVLSQVAASYDKKVMVAETSYAYTPEDTDFFPNTISDGGTIEKPYPFTVQGQANSVRDLIDTIRNRTANGIGVVYWEGTWNSVGTESRENNFTLWEQFGSGWATSSARSYDPEDAGKYFGGCAVDNQAFFDENGWPLESLKVFRLLKTGNELPVQPDAIEDVTIMCDLNAPLSLPETVNAVMSDNSRQALPVKWALTPELEARMHTGGPAHYEITGTAGNMTAKCYVSMIEYNYLTDYSFEEGGKDWVFFDIKKADELYVEEKKSDSLTGNRHAHFWSAEKNSVEFTLEQTKEDLPEGKYRFTVSIMGGDAGNTDIYAYVKVNGEIIGTSPMQITSYGNWFTASVDDIPFSEGDIFTVGVYVKCEGTGSGAWGKIDDAMLNSVKQ